MMEMIFWTCTIDKSAAVCSIATSSTGTEAPALAYFAVCLLGSRIYDLRFYASGRILSKTFHNSPIKNRSKIFFGKLQNVSKSFCRKYWCRKFSFENGKMACQKFSVENSNVCLAINGFQKFPKKISLTFIALPKTDYFLSTLHDYLLIIEVADF